LHPTILGAKWSSWAETITAARLEGREELAQVIGVSANNSLAPGTMAAYTSMRNRFADFTSSFTSVNSNMGKYRNLFIAQLIHLRQVKSIPVAVAALNFFYGRLSEGDAELQKLLIDSAKRDSPPVIHRRKATEEDIDAVVQWALREDTNAAVTEACIVLLSFLAFLRISETANVRRNHLEDKGNGTWWLRIPRSKTDQRGMGTVIAFKVQETCGILWNRFVEQITKLPKSCFIFATTSGSRPTTDNLRKRINNVLKKAGLAHRDLTSHSFRGGAATVALRKGISQEEIKRKQRTMHRTEKWKGTQGEPCIITVSPTMHLRLTLLRFNTIMDA
ncbi:site-specific recombinase, phage integrase family, partial [Oesophagostomum dentatum]